MTNNPADIGAVLMFQSLQTTDEIPVGTWFEYVDPRSGTSRRCTLSSRIEESRTLVDRTLDTIAETLGQIAT